MNNDNAKSKFYFVKLWSEMRKITIEEENMQSTFLSFHFKINFYRMTKYFLPIFYIIITSVVLVKLPEGIRYRKNVYD